MSILKWLFPTRRPASPAEPEPAAEKPSHVRGIESLGDGVAPAARPSAPGTATPAVNGAAAAAAGAAFVLGSHATGHDPGAGAETHADAGPGVSVEATDASQDAGTASHQAAAPHAAPPAGGEGTHGGGAAASDQTSSDSDDAGDIASAGPDWHVSHAHDPSGPADGHGHGHDAGSGSPHGAGGGGSPGW